MPTATAPRRPSTPGQRLHHRLIAHHAPLLLASTTSMAMLVHMIKADSMTHRLSLASAYVGLVLLAVTLGIGAVRAMRRRPIPLSLDLRRDIGIWAGVIAIVHTGVGLFVHLGNPLLYFFRPQGTSVSWVPRLDAFGASNYAGLVATIILAVLLATSNDQSVRSLGAARWKGMHRWIYLGAALVVVHGIVYQLLERRTLPFVLTFAVLTTVTAGLQGRGLLARRGRQTVPSEGPPRSMI